MDVKDILNERKKTHGDFTDNADIAQRLEDVIRSGRHWDKRTNVEKEAIGVICSKLARWVSAEYFHNDNPVDIAGYSVLVSDRQGLEFTNQKTD